MHKYSHKLRNKKKLHSKRTISSPFWLLLHHQFLAMRLQDCKGIEEIRRGRQAQDLRRPVMEDCSAGNFAMIPRLWGERERERGAGKGKGRLRSQWVPCVFPVCSPPPLASGPWACTNSWEGGTHRTPCSKDFEETHPGVEYSTVTDLGLWLYSSFYLCNI